MAVGVAMPTPSPVMNRARRRPGRAGHTRKRAAAASSNRSAATRTGRRPVRSERCPADTRPAATPTAYTANTTVTVNEPKPSRSSYSGYRGVGTVENATVTAKITATAQNPVRCRPERGGMPYGA